MGQFLLSILEKKVILHLFFQIIVILENSDAALLIIRGVICQMPYNFFELINISKRSSCKLIPSIASRGKKSKGVISVDPGGGCVSDRLSVHLYVKIFFKYSVPCWRWQGAALWWYQWACRTFNCSPLINSKISVIRKFSQKKYGSTF